MAAVLLTIIFLHYGSCFIDHFPLLGQLFCRPSSSFIMFALSSTIFFHYGSCIVDYLFPFSWRLFRQPSYSFIMTAVSSTIFLMTVVLSTIFLHFVNSFVDHLPSIIQLFRRLSSFIMATVLSTNCLRQLFRQPSSFNMAAFSASIFFLH
jgi:signal transduction histidine kinase